MTIENKDICISAEDAVMLTVTLQDYDWMQYDVYVEIKTNKFGIIHLHVNYTGTSSSQVTCQYSKMPIVNKTIPDKYIKDFLFEYFKLQEKSIFGTEAFDPTEISIKFYNAVITE